jgi:hypothetical protein
LYNTANNSTAAARVSHTLLFSIGVRLCATDAAVEYDTSTARYDQRYKYARTRNNVRVPARLSITSFPVGVVIEAMLEGMVRAMSLTYARKGYKCFD